MDHQANNEKFAALLATGGERHHLHWIWYGDVDNCPCGLDWPHTKVADPTTGVNAPVNKKQQKVNFAIGEEGNYYGLTLTQRYNGDPNSIPGVYARLADSVKRVCENAPKPEKWYGCYELHDSGCPHIHMILRYHKGSYPHKGDIHKINGGYITLKKLYTNEYILNMVNYIEKKPVSLFGTKEAFAIEAIEEHRNGGDD